MVWAEVLMSVLIAMLLSLSTPALAQDESEPEADTTGIVQIPEGTVVDLPGPTKPFTVERYSFMLPEPLYDRAITKAKQLEICQPALDRATDLQIRWMAVADEALKSCETQFGSDEKIVEDLRQQVQTLEMRSITAESKVRDLKSQRNTAWGITGGLILGAIAVTAVAVSL